MSKKEKELKKKKKKAKKLKEKDLKGIKNPLREVELPVKESMKSILIDDDSLSLEERIYAIPFYSNYDFNVNRKYQLKKAGLLEKYANQFILTTHEGGVYDKSADNFTNYVGKITKAVKEKFLNKHLTRIYRRDDAEYYPTMLQYVGVSLVTSDKYVLVLESLEGRLKGKYTMVQGHVDYDSSFMYTELEQFIAKNAYRELIEEVKFQDGTSLPLEDMDKEASYVINKSETLIDIEHIGFVYKYKLSDEDIIKVVSAEPEKHNVVLIPKEELNNEENIEKYDSWLSSIVPLIKK